MRGPNDNQPKAFLNPEKEADYESEVDTLYVLFLIFRISMGFADRGRNWAVLDKVVLWLLSCRLMEMLRRPLIYSYPVNP